MIVDVRTTEEYTEEHVEGAVNIPLDVLMMGDLGALATVERGALIQLYCASGARAKYAQMLLESVGYTSVTNLGGLEEAKRALGS